MKRTAALIIAAALICAIFCSCGAQSEPEATAPHLDVPQITYSTEQYTHVFNWSIDPDFTDFRSEKVKINGTEYDVRICGTDDDFILISETGDLYHKNTAAYPETTETTVKEIIVRPSDDSRTDKDQAENLKHFLSILERDDYTDEQPDNMRFLSAYYIAYKDYPGVLRAGAFVGSGSQYYFRFDGTGSEVYVNPRYYKVDPDFIA